MIAELLLIVDLLNKPSFRSMDYTSVEQVTPIPIDLGLVVRPEPIKQQIVVELDPATVSAYQERERIKRALREL